MKENRNNLSDHHCSVLEQRYLVSEMTQCDASFGNHERQYECYLEATKKRRENKACMYS